MKNFRVLNISYGVHPVVSTYPTFQGITAAKRELHRLTVESRREFYRRGHHGLTVERWETGSRLTFGVNLWEAFSIVEA